MQNRLPLPSSTSWTLVSLAFTDDFRYVCSMCSDRGAILAVYTIGHSSHSIERFIALLRRHGVATIVDVRSHPHSRWAPQFGKGALAHSLSAEGIAYVFLGRELGGRPGAEYHDEQGHVDYERRSRAPDFQAAIDRLVEIAHESPTAIMCAEEDPERCHRRHLIARALLRQGVAVLHIRGDSTVQPSSTQRP